MKNLLLIATLLLSITTYSQIEKEENINSKIILKEQRVLNLKPESSIINVPLEVDLRNYKNIVLSVEGWLDVSNEKEIRDALKQSIFTVERKNYKKNKTVLKEDTLYLFWNQSNEWDDRTTTLIIRDSNFNVLYSVTHTNVGKAKILSFLLSI